MNNSDTIVEISKKYFEEIADLTKLKDSGIFFCRQDGIVLYQNHDLGAGTDESSIGALLGGVWQAARTLTSFIPKDDKNDLFRLSFDTTSRGLYILPLELGQEEYYLCLLFCDEINPAVLKNKIRLLRDQFESYVGDELKEVSKNFKKKNQSTDVLFEDISDEEMDNLFSFSEGH